MGKDLEGGGRGSFKALSRHSTEETDKNHEETVSGYLMT